MHAPRSTHLPMRGGQPPLRRLGRHGPFFDLLEALRGPECAICSIAAQTRSRYLEALSYESVNDLAIRARLRQSRGFCNRHAWYLVEEVRDVFGTAIIYRDVLHTVQQLTSDLTHVSLASLGPRATCVGCLTEEESTELALAALGRSLNNPDVVTALQRSVGLCGPHLLRAVACSPPARRRQLVGLAGANGHRQPTDAATLRWRATGRRGTFGPNQSNAPSEDRGAPVPDHRPPNRPSATAGDRDAAGAEPFACAVCLAAGAELTQFSSSAELDDGISGVCNVHAWRAPAERVAPLAERQVSLLREEAQKSATAATSWLDQLAWLSPLRPRPPGMAAPLPCRLCQHQARLERDFCQTATGPLCLPHLRQALSFHGSAALAPTRAIWEALDQHLTDYIRKEDYRFRGEPRGAEQGAPRWAVALISGAPGIR
jgi:hypothetical protein